MQAVGTGDDAALAVQGAAAADQLDPPVVEPGDHAAVVEVVDDLIAPRQHDARIEVPAYEVADAGNAVHLGE